MEYYFSILKTNLLYEHITTRKNKYICLKTSLLLFIKDTFPAYRKKSRVYCMTAPVCTPGTLNMYLHTLEFGVWHYFWEVLSYYCFKYFLFLSSPSDIPIVSLSHLLWLSHSPWVLSYVFQSLFSLLFGFQGFCLSFSSGIFSSDMTILLIMPIKSIIHF